MSEKYYKEKSDMYSIIRLDGFKYYKIVNDLGTYYWNFSEKRWASSSHFAHDVKINSVEITYFDLPLEIRAYFVEEKSEIEGILL